MPTSGATSVVVGDGLDAALSELSRGRGKRRLAVAYVSGDAAERFPLRRGDIAVVDAHPATLEAGITDPTVLEAWLQAGADVYSYEGLHAKIYVVGATALIGSANLSTNSRDRLTEAAVVTNAPDVVAAAGKAVVDLLDTALLITEESLPALKRLYRPSERRAPGRGQRGVLPSTPFRMHLVQVSDWAPSAATAEKERQLAAAAGVDRRRAGFDVDGLWLDPGDESYYRPDDVLLHLWFDEEGQGWVEPPARVLATAAVDQRASMAWVVRERNAQAVPWDDVQHALRSAGAASRRTVWLRDPAARQAVLQLFGLNDVPAG